VAIPFSVIAVIDSIADPLLERKTVVVPALKVTICPESVRGDPLLFLTWTTSEPEKFEPTRATLGV
jgi:hypothetical protein